jgi:hypothetical protein
MPFVTGFGNFTAFDVLLLRRSPQRIGCAGLA